MPITFNDPLKALFSINKYISFIKSEKSDTKIDIYCKQNYLI